MWVTIFNYLCPQGASRAGARLKFYRGHVFAGSFMNGEGRSVATLICLWHFEPEPR